MASRPRTSRSGTASTGRIGIASAAGFGGAAAAPPARAPPATPPRSSSDAKRRSRPSRPQSPHTYTWRSALTVGRKPCTQCFTYTRREPQWEQADTSSGTDATTVCAGYLAIERCLPPVSFRLRRERVHHVEALELRVQLLQDLPVVLRLLLDLEIEVVLSHHRREPQVRHRVDERDGARPL